MATSRICSIPDCGKPVHGRDWCRLHYERWYHRGSPSPEALKGEKAAALYYRTIVLPYEGNECLIWPYSTDGNGYANLWFEGRVVTVSRLLCKEVHGEPPTPAHEAAHSCGRGKFGCVTKRHMSWKTRLANKADELVHGTRNRSDRNGRAKLTEDDVREIRALGGRMLHREIAAKFGVCTQNINRIVSGERWSWLK